MVSCRASGLGESVEVCFLSVKMTIPWPRLLTPEKTCRPCKGIFTKEMTPPTRIGSKADSYWTPPNETDSMCLMI